MFRGMILQDSAYVNLEWAVCILIALYLVYLYMSYRSGADSIHIVRSLFIQS